MTPFLDRRRYTPTIENQVQSRSVGQVQPPAPDQPNCPICKESFSEIKAAQRTLMTTRCGHIFCGTCLEMVKKANFAWQKRCNVQLVEKRCSGAHVIQYIYNFTTSDGFICDTNIYPFYRPLPVDHLVRLSRDIKSFHHPIQTTKTILKNMLVIYCSIPNVVPE